MDFGPEQVDAYYNHVAYNVSRGYNVTEKNKVIIGGATTFGGLPEDPDDEPHKKQRNTDKIANIKQLFEQDGFGKELAKCSQKTKRINSYQSIPEEFKTDEWWKKRGL